MDALTASFDLKGSKLDRRVMSQSEDIDTEMFERHSLELDKHIVRAALSLHADTMPAVSAIDEGGTPQARSHDAGLFCGLPIFAQNYLTPTKIV